ncbi:MAG: hypothetical protein HY774_17215 [Acidobacteria bacterium]|nr:hypothetical protein [Acidobacteriota bacterium]
MLQQVDLLVQERVFSSRSQAFQEALQARLREIRHHHFDAECRKPDPQAEQTLADFS